MPSVEHKQLISALNKMVVQEKWQRMMKKQGKIVSIEITKSGNMKIMLGTKNDSAFIFYVLKRNTNLYATAEGLHKEDTISVFLRRYLGKYFCTKILQKEQSDHHQRTFLP